MDYTVLKPSSASYSNIANKLEDDIEKLSSTTESIQSDLSDMSDDIDFMKLISYHIYNNFILLIQDQIHYLRGLRRATIFFTVLIYGVCIYLLGTSKMGFDLYLLSMIIAAYSTTTIFEIQHRIKTLDINLSLYLASMRDIRKEKTDEET